MNLTGTQRIDTHRLVLRPFRLEDAEAMYRNWASDPEVTRYLTWPAHASVDGTRAVLNSWIQHYGEGSFFNWGIEWKETGEVIGSIAVVRLNGNTEAAEIGYCLGRTFWGRGIMPEALRAVMAYLFDTVGLNRVAACHDVNNPRSGRVMEKAGMRREGILRGAGRNNQGICDEVWHAALRWDRKATAQRSSAPVTVRTALEGDLERVNALRRQVKALHDAGEPEIFKAGFSDELRDYLQVIRRDPEQEIIVAEQDGTICGFAVLHHIRRPENPFMRERDYLDVDEFCVDEAFRRQGVGSAMIRCIRQIAKERGFRRLELNMWEFNRGALAFYEAEGFTTYRRYMVCRDQDDSMA